MEQLPLSEQVLEQARKYPYNKCVFILPPWKEIYITDAERKQSWEEVLFTHEQMKETYAEFSYTVIELPKTSLKNRLRFITDFLNL
jgi:predicted ATPase